MSKLDQFYTFIDSVDKRVCLFYLNPAQLTYLSSTIKDLKLANLSYRIFSVDKKFAEEIQLLKLPQLRLFNNGSEVINLTGNDIVDFIKKFKEL